MQDVRGTGSNKSNTECLMEWISSMLRFCDLQTLGPVVELLTNITTLFFHFHMLKVFSFLHYSSFLLFSPFYLGRRAKPEGE